MARTPLIAGNWKMNLDHLAAIQLVQQLTARIGEPRGREVALFPPFTALRSIQTMIDAEDLAFSLGAQDCHEEPAGAFTGEIAAPMLAKLTCRYVICGHSERRHVLGETDERVARKAHAISEAGMVPILCVGETEEQRDAGRAADVVSQQLQTGLSELSSEAAASVVVAYEPVWAIGTGRTASEDDAQEMAARVRTELGDRLGSQTADGMRVLYGGSVKPGNASSVLGGGDVDGALVGGASISADDFAMIVGSTPVPAAGTRG